MPESRTALPRTWFSPCTSQLDVGLVVSVVASDRCSVGSALVDEDVCGLTVQRDDPVRKAASRRQPTPVGHLRWRKTVASTGSLFEAQRCTVAWSTKAPR